MTGIYGWLAGKAWWLVIVAALCAVILGQRAQVSNAKAATARVQAELADTKTAYAQAATKASEAARTEEARREAVKQEVIDHARQETDVAQAAARDASAAADGLRVRVAALVAAGRKAAGDPAPGNRGSSQPGSDPIGVLAGVFDRLDARAGELAVYADRLRIAGQSCERQYDGLLAPAGQAPAEVKP